MPFSSLTYDLTKERIWTCRGELNVLFLLACQNGATYYAQDTTSLPKKIARPLPLFIVASNRYSCFTRVSISSSLQGSVIYIIA